MGKIKRILTNARPLLRSDQNVTRSETRFKITLRLRELEREFNISLGYKRQNHLSFKRVQKKRALERKSERERELGAAKNKRVEKE